MAAQHAGQPMQTVVEVRNVGKRLSLIHISPTRRAGHAHPRFTSL